MKRMSQAVLFALLALLALLGAAQGQEMEWVRQFGSSREDSATGVAANDVGVYVAGYTYGTLAGQSSAGDFDAYLRGYAPDGNELWTRQFGTSSSDQALGVAADASGVYVAGLTCGTFPGQSKAGYCDAYLRKYDANGNVLWTRQFGTSGDTRAAGIAADASGVYVAGRVSGTFPGESSAGNFDTFLRKYDTNGNVLWTRQFGTSTFDYATRVAADASGAYVTGYTWGTLPGESFSGAVDAFLRRYDANGNHLWTRQFGTSNWDLAQDVAIGTSGIYVAGATWGTFPGESSAGNFDAFLRKYDSTGNVLWTRQFGTFRPDGAFGVATVASGVSVAGTTGGAFPGESSAGLEDAFIRTYDADGNALWTRQFGTSSYDWPKGVAASSSGIYVVGETGGTFPGEPIVRESDAFVAKFTVTPPDTTPPDTTITSYPPDPSNSSSAVFTFASSEDGSTFLCSLDGGAFAPCTSPKSYDGLADGNRAFEVKATDPAGNTDPTPASYAWTVDTAPPDATITSALDGGGVAVANSGATLSSAITFEFSGADEVTAPADLTFECSLDGAPLAPCASPQGYGGLGLSNHVFEVRATDEAGNQDPTPASHTWAVVTPAQAIENLIGAIASMGLPEGTANSLAAPLNQTANLLSDRNAQNDGAACGQLTAFINQANAQAANGQLTEAQAAQLIQAAQAVQGALGCS